MSEEDSILDNIEIHENFAIISVNPKLYPLSVIYSAAYWLLDRVHVIIDGDPETEILIEIRPKEKDKKTDLKEIGYQFNDELINYSVYTVQATRNKKLREMIMENALGGNLRNAPQQPQGNTERCDYPMQKRLDQRQFSSSWKAGEQPLQEQDIQKIRNMKPEDDILDNDSQGITRVQNYRHRQEEFKN